MDIQGFGGAKKGSVDYSVDLAGVFTHAYSPEDFCFSTPSFFRISLTKASQSQLLDRAIRSGVSANSAYMPLPHVYLWSDPFKVVCAVVRLVSVFVVDMISAIWFLKPANSDHPVKEVHPSGAQVPVPPYLGREGEHFSKNFPAPRNGIQVVKESVFDSSYFNAQHGVSPLRELSTVAILLGNTGKRKHG